MATWGTFDGVVCLCVCLCVCFGLGWTKEGSEMWLDVASVWIWIWGVLQVFIYIMYIDISYVICVYRERYNSLGKNIYAGSRERE